jgi:hypothetical protein
VCFALSEESVIAVQRVVGTVSLGWVVPCEYFVRNASYTAVTDSFFSNCRKQQLLCCEVVIFKTSGICGRCNNYPGHLKQNFREVLYRLVWVSISKAHLICFV